MKPFYMVYVQGNRSPTVCHLSLFEARDEAQRLARKEKRETYVLKVVEGWQLDETPVKPLKIESDW